MSTIIELEESAAINSKTMLGGSGVIRKEFIFDEAEWLLSVDERLAVLIDPTKAADWRLGTEEPEMGKETIRLWKDGTVDYGVFNYPFWQCKQKTYRDDDRYRAGKPLWWSYTKDMSESAFLCPNDSEFDTLYLVFVSVEFDHKTLTDYAEIGRAVSGQEDERVWYERESGEVIEGDVVRCVELPEGYADAIV